MGIKGLIHDLKAIFPSGFQLPTYRHRFENVFIECNSLLHASYRQGMTSVSEESINLYKQIFHKESAGPAIFTREQVSYLRHDPHFLDFYHRLFQRLHYYKPSSLIYASIDGLAPMAKFPLQSKRRAFQPESFTAMVNEKNGLTPGNTFIESIEQNFLSILYDYMLIQRESPKCIFDRSCRNGESETKIFQALRRHPSHSNLIFCSDADLILHLIIHKIPGFALDVCSQTRPDLKSVHVTKLVEAIGQKFAPTRSNLIDFGVLCLFYGNDYFGPLHGGHNKVSLRELIGRYEMLKKNPQFQLTGDRTFQRDNLYELLEPFGSPGRGKPAHDYLQSLLWSTHATVTGQVADYARSYDMRKITVDDLLATLRDTNSEISLETKPIDPEVLVPAVASLVLTDPHASFIIPKSIRSLHCKIESQYDLEALVAKVRKADIDVYDRTTVLGTNSVTTLEKVGDSIILYGDVPPGLYGKKEEHAISSPYDLSTVQSWYV